MNVASIMQKYSHTIKNCSLNTGTIFDLATGNFLPGKDGSMILNGGIFSTNAVTGRPQTYKSGVSVGYFGRVLCNYREAEGLCYETEMSLQGKKRVMELSGRPDDDEMRSRFQFFDRTELSLEDLFEVLKEMANEKGKNMKDLIRETPFLDEYGHYIKTLVPTIIDIDSWSAASSSKEISLYDEHNVGDSKTNMVAMNDGKIKSDFARQLPHLCGSKGIYLISTAHIGDNTNLGNPNMPPPKELPMMRQSDKLKHVGTQYSFLSTNMLETRKVAPMLDDKKKCEYPIDGCTSDVELQRITSFITRCKNNVSGASFDHISSQFSGLQEWLEYYILIKESKTALLEGVQKQKLSIHDQEFTRHTLRNCIAADPTFRRALEILGQFLFIRNRWNIPAVKALGYVEFTKMFNTSATLKAEILNSTGVWSFIGTPNAKRYLSIIDIIELISKSK